MEDFFNVRCPKCQSKEVYALYALVSAFANVRVNNLEIGEIENTEVDPSSLDYEDASCDDCEYTFTLKTTVDKDGMYSIVPLEHSDD